MAPSAKVTAASRRRSANNDDSGAKKGKFSCDDGGDAARTPLVTFSASPDRNGRFGHRCPFGDRISFALRPGSCVRLTGCSGAGKTTIATNLAGLSSPSDLLRLGVRVELCEWDPSIPRGERCGVLFQQTTLIDALTVAGNVCVALESCPSFSTSGGPDAAVRRDARIKQLLEAVGLDYARDASKRVTELSGGMARRASLALQLAQRKRVVVLDEPFAGLDRDAAASVARELVHLRVEYGTALLLISHEPDLAAMVMDGEKTTDNRVVRLEPPATARNGGDGSSAAAFRKPSLFGTRFIQRFVEKMADYVLWSLPLILLTFVACGLAISMLSSDILRRIDVTDQVISIVDAEVRPLLKMLTGEEENTMALMMVKLKVRGMLNTVVPKAKANLFALGMAKLFVLEIGPLLTALLLCGRIGGSYAGKVATMQATKQNELLRTLGINAQKWTLAPAMSAALLASPLLTVVGTAVALILGGVVGPRYGIGTSEGYSREVWDAVFPPLRLRGVTTWREQGGMVEGAAGRGTLFDLTTVLSDLRCTFSDSYRDAAVEVATYPPYFLLLKSASYIIIILGVAEGAARLRSNLTPRNVPGVITSSVVIASLLVIVADWGFSQLWLMRR